jgi:hypothetical protein
VSVSYVTNVLAPSQESEANRYLMVRGIYPYRVFAERPTEPWDLTLRSVEHISELRVKLLSAPHLDRPLLVTVRGTLFPSALLSAGWWERHGKSQRARPQWKDSLQEWLFNGFDLWAPSWDFTWHHDPAGGIAHPFSIAQLGGGDEADSIPVVIPYDKVRRLQDVLKESWGGIEAHVTGLLGHRHQFPPNAVGLELFGGLLDFCLWLDEEDKRHRISPLEEETGLYSGYLWKCVAPVEWLQTGRSLRLNQVIFVWEHTNFAKRDAVAYNLDSLARKEEYLRRRHGDLVLIQKSSPFVPGNPEWSHDEIFALLTGHSGQHI